MTFPSSRPVRSAIVIGGGFAGMAAALRVRALGWRVTLLERLDQLGGRGRTLHGTAAPHGPLRFDAGPTVITAPFLFEELFALFGERLSDHVQLLPVSPFYRISFADGRSFDYGGTGDAWAATRAEVARFAPGDLSGFDRLRRLSGQLYRTGFERFGATPFHRRRALLSVLPHIVRLGGHRSVYATVARHLRDEALRRVFSLQPLLVGGHPFHTSGLYALIGHLEHEHGVWYPRGGTGALVGALAGLLDRHGVEVRLGADVERIETAGRRATGVRLADGTCLPADAVVAAGDAPALYAELLPGIRRRRRWTPRRLDRLDYSMGLFVLFFATSHRFPAVAHHTIVLGERYRALLDEVFGRNAAGWDGAVPDDHSLYLHRPGATDPGMAPPDGDAFYVLAPVPNARATVDWDRAAPRLRDRVVALLEARLLPGLSGAITWERVMTPDTFRTDYRSRFGAGFSVSPRLLQSAWWRFHNRSEEVDNLFLAGAGTHPGAGVPGVLTSAKVVEALFRGSAAS